MNKYLGALGLLLCSYHVYATPTNYRGVEQRTYTPQVNHHPHPVFNHQAPQQPVYGNRQRRPVYPSYYPYGHTTTRPQVAIVTPHVGIYIEPEPQYHYQRTEEVYLPQGGTYRSTTEYIPTTPVYVSPRRVLIQGQYDLEQD